MTPPIPALTLVNAPSIEPIPLKEIKTFLRVDGDQDDELLNRLVTAARVRVEQKTDRALIRQTWKFEIAAQRIRQRTLALPKAPVIELKTLNVLQADGIKRTLKLADARIDRDRLPPRLVLQGDAQSALETQDRLEGEIEFGYGSRTDDVPEPLRLAVMQLVAHWHGHRRPTSSQSADERLIPLHAEALLDPFRVVVST